MRDMTNRQLALAVLRYQPYDRMPLVHFGYWGETLHKMGGPGRCPGAGQGGKGMAIPPTMNSMPSWAGTSTGSACATPTAAWSPGFERKVIKTFDDGTRQGIDLNSDGVVLCQQTGSRQHPCRDQPYADRPQELGGAVQVP